MSQFNDRIFLITLLLIFSEISSAHGGGLNKQGCHNETKTGGYHCHRTNVFKPPAKINNSYPNITSGLEIKCKITIGDEYFEFKPSEAKNINVNFNEPNKKVNIVCDY